MINNGRLLTFPMLSLISAIVLQAPLVSAAISSKEMHAAPTVATGKNVLLQATREALNMPLSNRIEALIEQGPQGYRNLVSLMFNESAKMETRWRAVTSVAMIGRAESKPELERAMIRPEWYMRNAALVAMTNISREDAIKWAKKLASDKALVVRASAVSTLGDLKDASSAPLLWQKLYAAENYRGKQSLFIRRRIVEALGSVEGPGREGKFVALLADKDETLHVPAIAALERMTKTSLSQPKDTLAFKRERWQKWWKEQGASAKF